LHLPRRPSDFTSTWLSAALEAGRAAPANAVNAVSVVPLNMSTGLTSDVYRLTPTYAPGVTGPPVIVAKMSSEDEVTAALGSSLRLFLREVKFFRELAGEAGIAVPKVYFADSETDSGRYVLLLEPAGRVGDEHPPHDISASEADRVLAALAGMHAKWWNSERLKEFPWLISGTSHNYNAIVQRKFLQAWPGVVEIGETLGPKVARLYDRGSAPPATLTHGTPRPQNIYFRGDPGSPEVMLISWQVVGVRPGPWDVSYLLAVGLPVEERRTHEMRLLRRYHDLLLAGGIRDYPFERVTSEYRTGMLRLLVMISIAEDNLDLSTPAGRGLLDRYIERSVALRDWKCAEVVPL
jgi:hypothetical protein